ncbi:hypothetical protein LIER_39373 [Lithospermum erythrorhizon]|uniref:Uncharacterized protein n=1 Tax=Lithospermum erythrorhizon TaxID=34254 RepID=A0AAV3QEN8_LITER
MEIQRELEYVQAKVFNGDLSPNLLKQMSVLEGRSKSILYVEKCFYRDKARVTWLEEGYASTAFFHSRQKAYVNYEEKLGEIITKKIGADDIQALQTTISSVEIEKALMKMKDGKTLGPDGMKHVLDKIMEKQQTTFILGRISEGIMLMQELVSGYHMKSGVPRCAIKRAQARYPLSPYLFIIVMDMFNELLNHRTLHYDFTFHPKYKELGIASVCFADNMFILCGASGETIEIMSNALKDFGE